MGREIGKTRQLQCACSTALPQGIAASRGVLALAPDNKPEVSRWAPPNDLAHAVAYAWTVCWDLSEQPAHRQETLPHPNVYLVLDRGKLEVSGVSTRKFTRVLEGKGWTFGVKFRPGGMRAFVDWPMARITDRVVPASAVFGSSAAELEAALLRAAPGVEMSALAFSFLAGRVGPPDDSIRLASWLVELIFSEPEIRTVDDIARRSSESVRALQRIFRGYVGVPPKWVIRRYRLHEVIDRMQAGEAPNWADLALELGYFDQAHLIREFSAIVGHSPDRYLRRNMVP